MGLDSFGLGFPILLTTHFQDSAAAQKSPKLVLSNV